METWLFYLFGGVALVAAVNVLAQRRIFYSAVSLIVCLCSLSGLYMLLEAPFIAAVQVIVYAGAIMVLFIFVIMLLDPYSSAVLRDKRKALAYIAVLLGLGAMILFYSALRSYQLARVPRLALPAAGGGYGTIRIIGENLFRNYLLPFEVTSILILIAIIGAVILAKRRA
jgi:NADH-quinone oxidoreductase subunit J